MPSTIENTSYQTSTQHRFFTFTPTTLATTRRSTNTLANQRLLNDLSSAGLPPPTEPALTAAEELHLLSYYASTLHKICTHFNTTSSVRATALTFLHRLYLRISPLTVHPKTLLLPILFLALKCELGGQSTSWFIRTADGLGLKTTKADLLGPETMIAMNLRWSFLVRHPWRSLEGLKAELAAVLAGKIGRDIETAGRITAGRVRDACGKARTILTGPALLADVSFLFSPPQCALGAVWAADEKVAEVWLDLRTTGEAGTQLRDVIKDCALLLNGGGEKQELIRGGNRDGGEIEVDAVEARRIDKKIHMMRKGLSTGGSGAKREAEKEKEDEERRRKKRKLEDAKLKEAMDMFGSELKKNGDKETFGGELKKL